MNKLSKDLCEIINTIKLTLPKKDVLQLIQNLIEHYDIKVQELAIAKEKVEDAKQQKTTIDGPFKVIPRVGVVLPSGKLLFMDGSENHGTKIGASRYLSRLPRGYSWHLMTKAEFDECKTCQPRLNDILRNMGGLPISYPTSSYLLADNDLERGYVRYCADIDF